MRAGFESVFISSQALPIFAFDYNSCSDSNYFQSIPHTTNGNETTTTTVITDKADAKMSLGVTQISYISKINMDTYICGIKDS